jgi:putative membrane protein
MALVKPKTALELAGGRTDLAPTNNEMAVERTVMAAERTLMAWIRTGLSMLSFGFTIYKFLLYVRESLSSSVLRAQGPRRFGIALIGLGTASMTFGLIDYYRRVRQLNQTSGRKPWSFVLLVGIFSVLLGAFLLFTILIHREVF